MKRPVITLLTDFGTADYYVAAMKGVILGLCPEAQLVDITHEIAPYQVTQAAWMLDQAWRCFPPGTIHVAVVDPGVGSERRPILMHAAEQYWVAPDNGLLSRVMEATRSAIVREITATGYFRHPVSQTFHGRDVFAPVAGNLAAGVPADKFGLVIQDPQLMSLPQPAQVSEREWLGEVLWIDRFGNIVTNFRSQAFSYLLQGAFSLEIGGKTVNQYEQYYGLMEPGRTCLTAGSAGFLEVSINQQDAGKEIGASVGRNVRLVLP